MLRLADFQDEPHLQARGFFGRFHQPGLPGELVSENGPTRAERLPQPELRPAPFIGEHTHEVIQEWLGLPQAQIDALVAAGDLEPGQRPEGL